MMLRLLLLNLLVLAHLGPSAYSYGLGQDTRDKRATNVVARDLKSEDPKVRWKACDELSLRGKQGAAALAKALKQPRIESWWDVGKHLGSTGSDGLTQAKSMFRMLGGPAPMWRANYPSGRGWFGIRTTIPDGSDLSRKEHKELVRIAMREGILHAFETFGMHAAPLLFDELSRVEKKGKVLGREYDDLRRALAVALSESGESGWESVHQAFQSEEPTRLATALLAVMKDYDFVDMYPQAWRFQDDVLRLARCSNPQLRWRAIEALAFQRPGTEIFRQLEAGLEDDDAMVRVHAARTFLIGGYNPNLLGKAKAGPWDVLTAGLEDTDPAVRAAAASGWNRTITPTAPYQRSLLIRLEDPAPKVRAEAVLTLVAIDLEGPDDFLRKQVARVAEEDENWRVRHAAKTALRLRAK